MQGVLPRALRAFLNLSATEMMPNGTLRPVIGELRNQAGACVIVSSSGSTAPPALSRRLAAMRRCVDALKARDAVQLDFYDRTRIVTWA
jgi:hypothetical protein